MSREQLCWNCKNACANRCCWMRDFTPVPGWVAKQVAQKNSDHGPYWGPTYAIESCPNFVKETECKKKSENSFTISKAVRMRINELLYKKNIAGWEDFEQKAFVPTGVVKTVARCRSKSVNVKTIFAVAECFDITVAEFFNSPIFDVEKIDF